jgi:hypothetical protein
MRLTILERFLVAVALGLTAAAFTGVDPVDRPSAEAPVVLVIEETGGVPAAGYDCPFGSSII